jgi:exodeoxyribonuclease VII small subunit
MNQDTEQFTFEDAMAGLQAAVEELRSDGLTLDRSLLLYERGIALAARCDALLTGAELRVTQTAPPAVTPRASTASTPGAIGAEAE